MKKYFFILILLALFLSGCITPIKERNLVSSNVQKVIDGDTIILEDNSSIRLLNINAPETGEPCSKEAKTKLSELVLNKTIWLERDEENQDKYHRDLRYIFLSQNKNPENFDDSVNLVLLKEGLVKLYILEPNTKYETIFRSTFKNVSSGCIFKKSSFSECFSIVNFNFDAEGDDCSNKNDEYVILKNSCPNIKMGGWQIKDAARNIYTFGNFSVVENGEFTLFTGPGTNSEIELYWNKKCIWNNDHDTFFLYDVQGDLVLEYNY